MQYWVMTANPAGRKDTARLVAETQCQYERYAELARLTHLTQPARRVPNPVQPVGLVIRTS